MRFTLSLARGRLLLPWSDERPREYLERKRN